MVNEHGKRIWSHKTKALTASKAYDWVDRILVIDESKNREVVNVYKFSEFDLTDWLEWSLEDYNNEIARLREKHATQTT